MFYSVYLFSTLILICNNFVRSNENVQKVTWGCATKDCSTPISDFITTTNLKFADHQEKLKYKIGVRGQVLKKPVDDSEFWYAQINGKKGYVNKNAIREEKKLYKDLQYLVEEDNPFYTGNFPNGGKKITPSQPTVVDGTTLYDNDLDESDSNKVLLPANSTESTPDLSYDLSDLTGGSQNSNPSTPADSVDSNKLSTEPLVPSSTAPLNSNEKIPESSSEVNPSPLGNSNQNPVENDDSASKSINDNKKNVGYGSSIPVDFEDDDSEMKVEEEEEEEEEEEVEVPSESPSTNKRDQSESNPKTEDESIETNKLNSYPSDEGQGAESVLKDVESTQPSSDTIIGTFHNPSTDSPEINNPEVSAEQISTETPVIEQNDIPSNIVNDAADLSGIITTQMPDQPQNLVKDDNISTPPVPADGEQLIINTPEVLAEQISTETRVTEQNDIPSNIVDNSADVSGIITTQMLDQPQNLVKDDEISTPSSIHAEGKIESDLNVILPPEQNTSTSNELDVGMDFNVKKESDSYAEKPIVDIGMETDKPSKVINQLPYNQYGSPYVYNKNQQQRPSSSGDTYPPAPSNLHNDFSTTPSPDDTVFSVAPEDVTNTPGLSQEQLDVTVAPELSSTEETNTDNLNESSDNEIESTEYYSTKSPHTMLENVEAMTASSEDVTSSPENIIDQIGSKSDQSKEEELLNDELLPSPETQPQDSPGLYSSVSSLFSSLTELFEKSKLPADDSLIKDQPEDNVDSENPGPTAPPGHCSNGITCKGLEPPIAGEDQDTSYWNPYSNVGKGSVPLSFNSILYICITSVVILLFSLGYYYIDKSQNSSALVAKVNQLSQELFVTKKERDTLEDQLLKIKENFNMMDSSKIKQDSKLSSLQNALEKSESVRTQLEETVIRLEKEVETLMDQGMEMHKLLSETISDEERSQMLLANIDELKESLSQKLDEIVTLTNQLDKKNEEIQLRQIDVRNASDRIADLERKLDSCKVDTEDTFTKKLQEQQKQKNKLQKLLEEKGVSIAKLESELAKTKAERDSAEARASSAEGGLQAAHGVGTGEARQTWLDATSARAALATAEKQNDALQLSIKEINTNNKLLQDKISSLSEEIANLNLKYEGVEKDKVNALTKLQVLSDYFKEKESKLQEELGVKESQWLQKETEDHTIYEQMKSLREEIASYKAQNEKLRGEILEQEASYKVQIANEEQKTYDNWVSLRQAERKVKELQMESAHFRNRLTQLETANNQSTTEALNPNGLDKGSFSAPSPPFMMLPPLPPAEFFSLPPAPIHPTASRPPPLGRISSPQLTGEMIPPPPLVPFDMYPPPPSSTPPPPIMYKPQPRDRPPPPKDSPPSNYSSESVNDKPPRRRRR